MLAFLPEQDLRPGDLAGPALDQAQRGAAVTAILLGRAGTPDHSLLVQATLAVELFRAERASYRVVPTYVDGLPAQGPHGLNVFHGIDLAVEGLPAVAQTMQAQARDERSSLPAPPGRAKATGCAAKTPPATGPGARL